MISDIEKFSVNVAGAFEKEKEGKGRKRRKKREREGRREEEERKREENQRKSDNFMSCYVLLVHHFRPGMPWQMVQCLGFLAVEAPEFSASYLLRFNRP